VTEQATQSQTVHCIICDRDYDREDRSKYRPAGIFEDFCYCEECLRKEKQGWGELKNKPCR
jgi:hypothetical protein